MTNVVLGGGLGGGAAAVALRATRSPHSAVLIDRQETGHLAGDNPFIVVGGTAAARGRATPS